MDPMLNFESMRRFGQPDEDETVPEPINSTQNLQSQINNARERNYQRLRGGLQGAADEAERYTEISELQYQTPWADLGTDLDTIRAITGGTARGVGMVAEGLGYITGEVVDNPLSRSLEALGKGITNTGQRGLDARSLRTQNAIDNTTITGNIFTGENLSFGTDPSVRGLVHQILPSLAEMAPQMAALFVGGKMGMALSIGTGTMQAGISQGNENYERLVQKSEQEMYEHSTSYRMLREEFPTMTHDQAVREVADTAKLAAFVAGGAVGGAGGALTRVIWDGPALKPFRPGEVADNAARRGSAAGAAGRTSATDTTQAANQAGTQAAAQTTAQTAAQSATDAAEAALRGNTSTIAGRNAMLRANNQSAEDAANNLRAAAGTQTATQTATQTGAQAATQTATQATAQTATQTAGQAAAQIGETSIIKGVAKRGALGFVEEGSEEVAEGLAATSAANAAIGGNEPLGENSLAEFVLGGFAGGTIGSVAGGVDALKNKSAKKAAEKQVEAAEEQEALREQAIQAVAATENITEESLDELLQKDYPVDTLAAGLMERAKNSNTTADEKKQIRKTLAQMDIKVRDQLETQEAIDKKGVDGYYNERIKEHEDFIAGLDASTPSDAEKASVAQMRETAVTSLAKLREQQAAQNAIDPAARKQELERLRKAANVLDQSRQQTQQAISDQTPDDTDTIVATANDSNADTATRTEAVETLITRSLTNPGQVSNDQLGVVYSSSKNILPDDMLEALNEAIEIRSTLDKNPDLLQMKESNSSPALAKHADMIDRALTAGDMVNARTGLNYVASYGKYLKKQWEAYESAVKKAETTGVKHMVMPIKPDGSQRITGWNVFPVSSDPKEAAQQEAERKKTRGALYATKSSRTANVTNQLQNNLQFARRYYDLLKRQISRAAGMPVSLNSNVPGSVNAASTANTPASTGTGTGTASTTGASAATGQVPSLALTGNPARDQIVNRFNTLQNEIALTERMDNVPASIVEHYNRALFDTWRELMAFDSNNGAPGSTTRTPSTSGKKSKNRKKGKNKKSGKKNRNRKADKARKRDGEKKKKKETGTGTSSTPSSTPESTVVDDVRVLNDDELEQVFGEEITAVRASIDLINRTDDPGQLALYLHNAYVSLGRAQKENNDTTEPSISLETQVQILMVDRLAAKVFNDMPKMKELVDLINTPTGAEFRDVALWAYRNGDTASKAMLKKMSPTQSFANARRVTFNLSPTSATDSETVNRTAAFSFDDQNTIITPKRANNETEQKAIERTAGDVVHEILHPITETGFEKDPEFAEEVVRLQAHVSEWLNDENNVASLPDNLQQLIQKVSGELDYAIDLDQPYELITSVLGSRDVAAIMAAIPDPDSTSNGELSVLDSVYKAILDFVSKAFNLTPDETNVLESILKMTDSMIEMDTPASTDGKTGTDGNQGKDTGGKTNEEAETEEDEDDDEETDDDVEEEEEDEIDPERQAEIDARREERVRNEKAVKNGDQPFYTHESDGDIEYGHEGAFTNSEANTGNLIRAHFKSRRRTPMSYSDNFIEDVLLSDDYPTLKSLSAYLSTPQKSIADFRKKGRPDKFKPLLKFYHEKWRKDLQDKVKAEKGFYRLLNPTSYFFNDDGVIDPNFSSAVAMGAWNYLVQNGNSVWHNSTDKQVRDALELTEDAEVTGDMRAMMNTIGVREKQIQRQIGRDILKMMDMEISRKAPKNEKGMVEAAIGAHALALLLRDGFYERTTYTGLDTTARGMELSQKLRNAEQFPDQSILSDRNALREHLEKTELTQQERTEFFQHAFATHTFIRSYRLPAKEVTDVRQIIKKLNRHKLWDKKLTQAEFDERIDKDTKAGLTEAEKARIKDVYYEASRYVPKGGKRRYPPLRMSLVAIATRGSRGFMDDLLGANNPRRLPTTDISRAGFKDKTKTNSRTRISPKLREKANKAAKQPHKLQQGLLATNPENPGILTRLMNASDNFLTELSGATRPGTLVHVDDIDTITARDEQYAREQESLKEMIDVVMEGDSSKAFYKYYAVWGNDRLGEVSQGFNTQASLMHRAMETNDEWNFTVDPDDSDSTETRAFKYAAVQGLGVGIDKRNIDAVIALFDSKFANPALQEVLDYMDMMRQDPQYTWTKKEQRAVLDALSELVNLEGKEGPQAFRTLLELAKYREALNNNTSFDTDLSAEVDGRANGAAFAMLQMGMDTSSAEERDKKLILSGLIPVHSEYDSAGDFQEAASNDIYKAIIDTAADIFPQIEEKFLEQDKRAVPGKKFHHKRYKKQMGLINFVMGDLKDAITNSVTAMAREAAKEPITSSVFGAGTRAMMNTLSRDFVSNLRAKLVQYARDGSPEAQKNAHDLIKALNENLLKKQRIKRNEDGDYTDVEITPAMERRIRKAVDMTMGDAVSQAVNTVLGPEKAKMKVILKVLTMIQGLYKAAYNEEKRQLLNNYATDKAKEGDPIFQPFMENRYEKGGKLINAGVQYQPDISEEQHEAIVAKLANLYPFIHSASSIDDKNRSVGLDAFKQAPTMYHEINTFTGEPFNPAKGSSMSSVRGISKLKEPVHYASGNFKNHASEFRFIGQNIDWLTVNIGALAKSIHSMDARVAIDTFVEFFGINTHDGFTSGAMQMAAMGKKANENFLDINSRYSMITEIAISAMQVVDSFNLVRGRYANSKAFQRDVLDAVPREYNRDTGEWELVQIPLIDHVTELLKMADSAERGRLEALSDLKVVDQYYYPGSGFPLSKKQRNYYRDRAKRFDLLKETAAMRSEEAKAVDGLDFEEWLDFANAKINPDAVSRSERYTPPSPAKSNEENDEAAEEALFNMIIDDAVDASINRTEMPALKKKPIHRLTDISRELNRNGMKLIQTLNALSLSEEEYMYYLGELLNPNSTLLDIAKPTQNKRLREWHKAHHAKDPNDKLSRKGTVYSPGISPTPISYSTEQVFDALNKNQLPDAEATHLKSLLKEITGKLYTNIGALPGLTVTDMGLSVDELAARHRIENIGPFSSNLHRAGITLNEAQSFVAEQIEISLQSALASQTLADNAIVKIYRLAKQAFHSDGREFYLDANGEQASDQAWQQATPEEKARAKQAYDLIFTTNQNSTDSRSDHLSRFVALSLVYPPMRNQLDRLDNSLPGALPGEKLGARLSRYYDATTENLSQFINGIRSNTAVSKQMETLAKKLALNEHKRRIALNRDTLKSVSFIDESAEKAVQSVQKTVVKAAKSDLVRNSSQEIVQGLGALASTVAEDRVDEVVRILEQWRDDERKNVRQGLIGSMISNIRGETEATRVFYDLLSGAKRIEQNRKKKGDVLMREILERFEKFDTLTDEEKGAMTQLYLRSDAAALLDRNYSVEQIHEIILDKQQRQARIKALKKAIAENHKEGKRMVLDTIYMSYEMATGRNVSPFLYQSPYMIFTDGERTHRPHQDKNENWVNPTFTAEEQAIIDNIDELGTLLAIEYTPHSQHLAAQTVIARESNRGSQDALRYILYLHKRTREESNKVLFENQLEKRNFKKGYVRETYNPYNTYKVAGPEEGAELIKLGYEEYGPVANSSLAISNLNTNEIRNALPQLYTDKRQIPEPRLYVLRGVGLSDYTTGAIMNTRTRGRGSMLDESSFMFEREVSDENGISDKVQYHDKAQSRIEAANIRRRVKKAQAKKVDLDTFRPGMHMEVHEAPIFNHAYAYGYRYLASHATRDEAMQRDNRIESVLAHTVASQFNKTASRAHNIEVLKTLREFEKTYGETDANSFIEISKFSPDPEIREMAQLLPNYLNNTPFKVHKDLVNLVLGYRNLTTDVVINQSWEKMNRMLGKEITRAALSDKQAITVRRWHDHAAHIMRQYRDFIVVRNFSTLYQNVKSNAVLLYMHKVPIMNIVKGHRRAFQALKDFQEQEKELLKLQTLVDASADTDDRRAEKAQIRHLQHLLDRNPIKPLIDEGLYQTVLDDVDLDKENTLYMTDSEKFVERWAGKLPASARKGVDIALVEPNTWLHRMLSQGTQMSDLIARFVLYEHLKSTAAKTPVDQRQSHEEIISDVREAFVNYNVPSHPLLQYMNDVGLVMFTKYYLGTQKVLYQRLKKAPSRAMVAYLADQYVDNLDTVLSSNMLTNIGNPFRMGPLTAPTVIDEPVPIAVALGLMPG